MSTGNLKQEHRSYQDINLQTISTANEPSATYEVQLIKLCRSGITRQDFMAFTQRIGSSIQALVEIIPASYSSLTKKDTYDQETSERIIELARLYAYGQEVFGDNDKFSSWLHSVSISLGGVTPFSLLDTSFGFKLVRDEIGRIDYGIF